MTFPAYDGSDCLYDKENFTTLNTVSSFHDNSQITSTESDMISTEYIPSKFGDLFNTKSVDEFNDDTQYSCATQSLAPSYPNNEQLFSENQLTISSNNNENDTLNNELSEFYRSENEIFTPDIIENIFKYFDEVPLQSIDNSILQRRMSIEVQPPADLRPRYKSDGTRQIEESRTKPMVVKLPDLRDIQLETNQSFLIRLILITYDPNPSAQVYHHADKLEYHSHDMQVLNDGTPCIPLTADDIKEGKKEFPRLSMVRTKLAEYKPGLMPFRQPGSANEMHENTNNNEDEKVSVKMAKIIYKQFNLKASRIACQLLIKQSESIHFTNIACETHVLNAKDQKNTTNKRSANTMNSDNDEPSDKRPTTSKSKSYAERPYRM